MNKLTPRGSNGFIGGFFFERDLFPTTDNTQLGLEGCAGSNFGEMFYVLAPDSLAQFGDQRKKSDVVEQSRRARSRTSFSISSTRAAAST